MKQIFFPKYMAPNHYDKKNKKTKLTRIKLRLYYCLNITSIITTDSVCVKTDVSKMFHESEKGDWFNYILW